MKLLLSALPLFALLGFVHSLDCGDGKIRGVNLGGLFMLEPWITPTIFEEVNEQLGDVVVDEYTYAQYVDPAFAADRLDRHWDEFYSLEDLEALSDSGISHVRIPVGYWLVDVSDDEFFPPPPATDNDGMRKYLKRVLGWCNQLGLKVLIDLHGAPGSQNGFDNSGRRGPVNWVTEDLTDIPNVDRTVVILDKLTELIMSWVTDGTISEENLYGIAMLNEPLGFREYLWEEIRDDFHYRAYDAIRAKMPNSENRVVIQQAFRNPADFIGYMPESDGYMGVGLDLHNYQCFGDYWNNLAEQPEGWGMHLDAACSYVNDNRNQTLETVTGEWSLAVTDCQKYLDGGYDNPYVPPNASPSTCAYYNGNFTTYPDDYKTFLGQYMLAQMDAYEEAKGWFFWTGKTENNCGPEWDYLFLLQNGIAPANLCEKGTYCVFN